MSDRDIQIRILAETERAERELGRMADKLKVIDGGAKQAAVGTKAFGDAAKGTAGNVGALSDKLNALSGVGVPGMGRLSSAFQGAEQAGAAFGKSSLALSVALGGTVLAAGALGGAMFKAVAAASDGEQATVRLTAALKAQGLYSEKAVSGVQEWAEELLKVKGVNDELAATLVAQGVTMGLSIKRTQELVSISADMAPVMGSIETAFDAVARAAAGDTRALQTLGRQFGIVTTESSKFDDVLKEIARRTDGNAAALVSTFAGEWKLFGEEVGNFLEKAGTPLMKWLAEQPGHLRAAGRAWDDYWDRMSKSPPGQLYAFFAALEKANRDHIEFLRQRAAGAGDAMIQSGHGYAAATTTQRSDGYVEPDPNQVNRGRFYEYTDIEAGIKRAAQKRAEDAAETKRLEEEATQFAERQEKLRFDAAQQSIEDNAQMHRDYLLAKNVDEDFASKDAEKKEAERYARSKEQIEENLDMLRQAFFLSNQIDAMDKAERASPAAQEKLTGGEQYGPRVAIAADYAARATMLKSAEYLYQTDRLNAILADKNRLDEHAQASADLHELKMAQFEKEAEIAYQITDAIVGIAKGEGIGRGVSGVGSALSSLGGEAGKYGAIAQTSGQIISGIEAGDLGQTIGSVIGAVVGAYYGGLEGLGIGSAIGGALGSVFDPKQTTRGKAEGTVGAYLADLEANKSSPHKQYQNDYYSNYGSTIEAEKPYSKNWKDGSKQFGGDIGRQYLGIAEAWSELIGGPSATGEKLLGWLDRMGMTMEDASKSVAVMVSEAQGITEWEAQMTVAKAAFGTGSFMWAEDAGGLAATYASGSSGYAAWEAFQAQIEAKLKSMSGMDQESEAWRVASQELADMNNNFSGLKPPQVETAENTKKSAEYLSILAGAATAGGDSSGVVHTGQFPVFHGGHNLDRNERMAIVRNDELIAPPERFREAAEYLGSRGFASRGNGGGDTYIIHGVVGNHRDVAKLLRRENGRSVRRREVAA